MFWQGISKTETITLFEYEFIEITDGYELKCLDQLSKTAGIEILKPVVKNGQLQFQARQYVGVIRLGRRTIQVLPKIYRSNNQELNQLGATRNLLFMLDYAGYLGIREVNLAALQRSQNWFEVLIHLFTSHLRREWQKNAHRSYQSIDAVLPVLKGKWQMAAQLRRPEQKHLFTVTYDEFTVDNPLNRVFRYVVEKLWHLTQDNDNRQGLTELKYWMAEVSLLPAITADMAKQIQLSRLNHHYQPLLNLACLFLERMGLQLSANNVNTFSFVFDMNQLFERFITGFIQRHRNEILPLLLKQCELLPQGQSAVKSLASRDGQQVFRLKPDLIFKANDLFPVIVDIKYKQLDENDRKLGVAESDFYQMYAYAHRYACPQTILLYPKTVELSSPQRASFRLEGGDQMIRVATVNLLHDLSTSEARQALQAELRGILEAVNE